KAASEAPRRGMSRTFTIEELFWIAVAARLLRWGLELSDILEKLGDFKKPMFTDEYLQAKFGRKTFIQKIWEDINNPETSDNAEILLIFPIVESAEPSRVLLY